MLKNLGQLTYMGKRVYCTCNIECERHGPGNRFCFDAHLDCWHPNTWNRIEYLFSQIADLWEDIDHPPKPDEVLYLKNLINGFWKMLRKAIVADLINIG